MNRIVQLDNFNKLRELKYPDIWKWNWSKKSHFNGKANIGSGT
jgi:hypothetical protein